MYRDAASVEQARNRFFLAGAADGFADQAGGRDDADVVGRLHRGGRLDGIRDHQFLQHRGGNAGACAAGEHAVGDVGGDAGSAVLEQRLGGVAERAAGIDDVVDQDAILAVDVTNDVHDLRFTGAIATLVDDRQQTVEPLGKRPGTHDAADVRRNDRDVLKVVVLLDVARQDRNRIEIVGRDIEEALDLAGMEIEGEDAVGAGFGDEVGDQLGGDRGAGSGLAVLPA